MGRHRNRRRNPVVRILRAIGRGLRKLGVLADFAEDTVRWLVAALIAASIATMLTGTALELKEIGERGAGLMTAVIGLLSVAYAVTVWGVRAVRAVR